jgi:hypothetical protein
VTRICRYLPLLVLTLFSFQFASAQSTFDFNFGFGAAQDKANSVGIDTNSFLACNSSTLSGACAQTSSLSSFMIGIGGNLMLWKHFGVGVNAQIEPSQAKYTTLETANAAQGIPEIDLKTRVTFYQFDGTYQPISSKKANLQLIGGFGGANVKFYESQSSTGSLLGNFNQSQYASSSNHFQVHAGVGVQVYVSGNIFVRPQFDIHYVPNFIQFGRNVVTEETFWIGYSFGNR